MGGGVIGAACARELARAGWRVLILDPDTSRGQAWRLQPGCWHPRSKPAKATRSLELGLAGRELYAELAPSLQESTGIDIGFWREGIANVALTRSGCLVAPRQGSLAATAGSSL